MVKQDSANDHKDQTDSDPPKWYAPLKRPEWWLVGAAFLTLYVVWRQVRESVKATKAMRDSIRLQQAGMQQWVDVDAVASEPAGRTYVINEPDFAVNLTFEAINNTANVLTIIKIETIVGMMPDESEVFTLKTNVTLPPKKESENNRYSFFVPSQSILREWFDKGTTVTINGSITFIDCLGETRSDYFGGLYHCSDGRLEKLKALGIIPTRTVESSPIPRLTGKDASGNWWDEKLASHHFWMRWKWQLWRFPKPQPSDQQDRPKKAN